jgi:hypothetical protein
MYSWNKFLLINIDSFTHNFSCDQSRWPLGLRCGSVGSRLLGLRVWIPPGYRCLSLVSVSCQVEVSASGWLLNAEDSYRVYCVEESKGKAMTWNRIEGPLKKSLYFNSVLLLNLMGVPENIKFSSYSLRCSVFVLRKFPNNMCILQIISAKPLTWRTGKKYCLTPVVPTNES